MAQEIAALLKRWAELRNMLRETEPVSGGPWDPAIEMLRRCISELYDALKVSGSPCEERMPPPDEIVWIGRPGELRGLAYLDGWGRDCWWLTDNESLGLGHITHWAEADLPGPPGLEEAADASTGGR